MISLRIQQGAIALTLAAFSAGMACSSDEGEGANAGSGASAGTSVGSAGTTSGGSTSAGGSSSSWGGSLTYDGGVGICGDASCTCSNGLDDDDDGLIDGFDPECTGPLDNDESTFATGIPGDNRDPKWQDCFFDGNSGAGDDGCRYHTDCLYGTKAADDPDCSLTDACVEFCAQRTPNGCDCFGCCTIMRADGSSINVLTGTTCSIALVDDADACPICTKSTECTNDCGECELCPGKTEEDLPETCTPPEYDAGIPPPNYTCLEGQVVCGPDLPPCENGLYCSFGCCITSIR